MKTLLAMIKYSYSVLVMGELALARFHCQNLLQAGAKIHQIFFYGQAVQVASTEPALQEEGFHWLVLQQQYQLRLWLCQDAAVDWGILPEMLTAGFIVGSLGQFAENGYQTEKLLTFGVHTHV